MDRGGPPRPLSRMRIVDAHVHLYPPGTNLDPTGWAAAHGETHWATLCTRVRKNGRAVQGFPSLADLLREMDAAGVAKAVLLGWYWENQASCVEQNRFYADCVRAHPDRLAAFATLHPAAGAAALDEVRWAREAGFAGLGEFSPHSQHVPADDGTWRAVLALAGELGLPVNLHVTDPSSRQYPGRVETPTADFVQLAQEFPATTFILAHWGGGLAFDPRLREVANLYFDSAASPLLYGPDVWERAAAAVGPERLLFGSDFPLVLYPEVENEPHVGGLLAEARAVAGAGVLGANAARLLAI